jgi:Site-specific recombinase XerD
MARLKRGAIPGIRHHKPSGMAVVTLSGQDFYLATWGTKAAIAEYDRVVNEWLARSRHPLVQVDEHQGELTLLELAAAYKRHAKSYYVKNGKVTSEYHVVRSIVRVACELYGREPADSFDALKLQAVQQAMIRLQWARTSINRHTDRLVKMFSWGAAQKLIAGKELIGLREVKGLRKGRTDAVESAPVLPVEESTIQATLHHLPQVVADMVKLQRLTGCRPEELCLIRPCDIESSGPVWFYRPESHKTQHHGHARVVCIGPKGQEVLRPYLLRANDAYCFSPMQSEHKRLAEVHEARVTPISYGNRPGSNRRARPKRKPGEHYTTASYRRAIHRGCDKAKIERWSPNRLRHSAATEIRKRFGLEASQVVLGHSAADVTQVYAERDLAKAAEVMAKVG